ncbi:Ger(x)C family spore germination protein [Paenibacillus sp. MBLB2552]|uniref:Ger(X)C family spore germination protein n=1 Tax=Paenibacillus mellifer TaxID=2937794 RepID=A0A9X1XWB2_9BACL|nr:Ger(x)C family spore germination protein [Paenibacillus mellifer]MCK8486539.1 Ger(x)C family spore germination protein [Paenibacillus mellifer]
MTSLRKSGLILFAIVPLLLTAGCWDSSEVNDLALELAWGIDAAKDQGVMVSAQVIVPFRIGSAQGSAGGGGGGSQEKPYFVVAGIGKDTLDAVQQMQTKLSRQMFRAHRRVIVIGEALARRGLKEVLDTYSRDPTLKLRSDVFIMKGGTANEFLKVAYPLEDIPGLAALKEYNQIGALKEMGLINLMISATSDGNCPALPVIAIGFESDKQEEDQDGSARMKGFRINGTSIFDNDLKLLGYIDTREGRLLRWVKGELGKLIVTADIPQDKGRISFDMNKLNSKVQPIFQGDNIKFHVTLSGQGMIRENNSNLDLTQTHNLAFIKELLEKQVEASVQQTIRKVQREFGSDVFEFGETIHRKHHSRWNSLKDDWNQEFRKAEVTVKANLSIRRIGVTGPSLHLKEDSIQK